MSCCVSRQKHKSNNKNCWTIFFRWETTTRWVEVCLCVRRTFASSLCCHFCCFIIVCVSLCGCYLLLALCEFAGCYCCFFLSWKFVGLQSRKIVCLFPTFFSCPTKVTAGIKIDVWSPSSGPENNTKEIEDCPLSQWNKDRDRESALSGHVNSDRWCQGITASLGQKFERNICYNGCDCSLFHLSSNDCIVCILEVRWSCVHSWACYLWSIGITRFEPFRS